MNSWLEGEVAGEALGDRAVPGRVAGAVGRDAVGRAAQHRRGHPREIGAVGAAAERHDDRPQLGERLAEAGVLLHQPGVVGRRHRGRGRRGHSSSSWSVSSSASSRSSSSSLLVLVVVGGDFEFDGIEADDLERHPAVVAIQGVAPLHVVFVDVNLEFALRADGHTASSTGRTRTGPASGPGRPGGVRVTADTPTVVATGAWIIATSRSGPQRVSPKPA